MNSDLEDVEMQARLIERAMQPIRVNTVTEAIVNLGLAVAHLLDLEAGIAIMNNGNVPAHVVKRVLRDPKHRRAIDGAP